MRWKLITLSSLIAALIFVLVWFILAQFNARLPIFLLNNWFYWRISGLILIITINAIFVYRHTAKRRKTQAFLASLFTFFLILAAFSVFDLNEI
jgi:hypothetical protein